MRLLLVGVSVLLTLVRGFNDVEDDFIWDNDPEDLGMGDLPDLPTTEAFRLPTTEPTVSTSSPESGPGQLGIWDPNPFPVIDSFPRGVTVREGDSLELECKASDLADHLPNWEKHDLEMEVFFVNDPKRDLTSPENNWFEDVSKSVKSRPSHPKGRIDISESVELFLYKESVKKEDEGWYRCRACIYKGDPVLESCDQNNAKFYIRVLSAGRPQDNPEQATTSTPYKIPGDITFQELPRSSCQLFGDPHVISFDGSVFNLPGASCDYVLALDQDTASFFIYGRMRPCGNVAHGVCLESVTIYASGDAIELQRGWLVNYRGEKHETVKSFSPITLGPFVVEFRGTTLEVLYLMNTVRNSQDWLKVYWDGFTAVSIEVPQSTSTQGLCGNNNRDPIDDFDVWGSYNVDVLLFSNSLKVDRNGLCGDAQIPFTMDQIKERCGTKKFGKAVTKCERIFNSQSLVLCHNNHDPQPFIDACTYDQCKGMNIQNDLYDWMVIHKVDKELPPGCNAAEAYALKCSSPLWSEEGEVSPGIDMSKWEEDTLGDCPSKDSKLEHIPKLGCPQSWMEGTGIFGY